MQNSKFKIQFAHRFQLTIQPYHSKYNPVERAFGWLEQHWCGSLPDTVDTVLRIRF
ncbi:ISAzo13-like element transposase-related protein [Trichormus azollae]|uniref:ISAzo13-like element transposase-related protein n=1 Tax=Trichormus azollae TaxID=1164 RepID=UPI00325C4787